MPTLDAGRSLPRSARAASFLLCCLCCLALACGSDVGDEAEDVLDGLNTMGVEVDIDRQTVPGATPLTSCNFGNSNVFDDASLIRFSVDFRNEDELDQGDAISRLDSVVLRDVTLTVRDVPSGDSDNFDFVDSLRLYADDPNDTQPEVLVAELSPVPNGATTIVIPGTGVELVDLADANPLIVRGEVDGRPPCDSVTFDGVADFRVEFF
jgi:hypothetical protein